MAPTLWAGAFFFFVLSSNLVLRALRGQVGVSAGRDNLPLLFTGTFITALVANALYWSLANRLPRKRFVPLTYHFIAASLLVLYVLLSLVPEGGQDPIKFAFFIWYSVINLFTVCLFWVCMVDAFTDEQAKRLFGFIGVGGTAGGMTGSLISANFVHLIGNEGLLILSLVLLEMAVFCSAKIARHSRERAAGVDQIASGGILEGLKLAMASPYLRSIGLYIFLMSSVGTLIYIKQVEIVGAAFSSEEDRTAYGGWVDFATQTLTLLVELFLTARLIRLLGVGGTLLILPLFAFLGLLALGISPTLQVLAVIQVLFATGRYSLAKPSREVLFTVVGKEEKYKSKSFTDTFVPRMSDVGTVWASIPIPTAFVSWVVLPLAGIWSMLGPRLGGMYRAVVRERS